MSKTLLPGIQGRYGGDGRPAIIVAVSGFNAVLRVFAQHPDDDATVTDSPEYTALEGPVALADVLGPSTFVASHPVVIWCDNEAGLAAYVDTAHVVTPAGAYVPMPINLLDTIFVVRNASRQGPRQFYVVMSEVALVPVLVPFTGNVPTIELSAPNTNAFDVPAATDVVLGAPGYMDSLDVVLANPGADPGSPFEPAWSYADGVIGKVIGPYVRIAVNFVAATLGNAEWRIVAQRQLGGVGPWVDVATLAVNDISGLLSSVAWTFAGFAGLQADTGDSIRVVIRHNQGGTRSVDAEKLSIIVNTISILIPSS